MDITNIVEIVIALIGALISAFLIPWLKAKVTAEKRAEAAELVGVLVRSAEQIFGSGKGREKLLYVADGLKRKGYYIDVDDAGDALRSQIEAAVLELK